MKTTIGELRSLISKILEANTWANYSRDTLSPATDDREAIQTMKLKTPDGEDELSGHLLDAGKTETDEEIWGPVPPRKDGEAVFHVMNDPFANDWNITGRNRP